MSGGGVHSVRVMIQIPHIPVGCLQKGHSRELMWEQASRLSTMLDDITPEWVNTGWFVRMVPDRNRYVGIHGQSTSGWTAFPALRGKAISPVDGHQIIFGEDVDGAFVITRTAKTNETEHNANHREFDQRIDDLWCAGWTVQDFDLDPASHRVESPPYQGSPRPWTKVFQKLDPNRGLLAGMANIPEEEKRIPWSTSIRQTMSNVISAETAALTLNSLLEGIGGGAAWRLPKPKDGSPRWKWDRADSQRGVIEKWVCSAPPSSPHPVIERHQYNVAGLKHISPTLAPVKRVAWDNVAEGWVGLNERGEKIMTLPAHINFSDHFVDRFGLPIHEKVFFPRVDHSVVFEGGKLLFNYWAKDSDLHAAHRRRAGLGHTLNRKAAPMSGQAGGTP